MKFFYRLKRAGLVPMDAILDHYKVVNHYGCDFLVVRYRHGVSNLVFVLSDMTIEALYIRMHR